MQLTGIRKKVFLDRYALKDAEGNLVEHTPEEMWKRVAKGIAKEEKKEVRRDWEKKFYEVMRDFKFVPGGRILSGAGTGYQVTYFNCFVIPSPKDSRGGILDSLGQLIEIQARSGGVGLNLSSLRPKGARVKKVNGTSSGPVNWATLFSVATHDIVQQGGSRRGATMIMLWDWHPDVEEFITVKQDLTKIAGANLSVCISDAFMEAVKKDQDWELVYPDLSDLHYDTEWDGDIIEWKKKGYKYNVHKTVKAKELWDLICTAAWQSAEPGLHFLERSNKRSNTYYFEKLISTNPSLRAGTKVLTSQGIFPIEQLEGKKFFVKNLDGQWSDAECFLSGRNKTLYKITLYNGQEIFSTAEHKWPVKLVGGGFGKITTDKLQTGNILPFPKAEDIKFTSPVNYTRESGFMLGWLYGDGWISKRSSNDLLSFSPQEFYPERNTILNFRATVSNLGTSNHAFYKSSLNNLHNKKISLPNAKDEWAFGLLFSKEESILAEPVLNEVNKLKRVPSALRRANGNLMVIQVTSSEFASNLFTRYGVSKKENGFPDSVWHSGGEFIKGFVDGLISSDGFVAKNAYRIVYTTKHKKLAQDFSALLSFYGIKSYIKRSEATRVRFPNNQEYNRIYERFDVTIDGYNAVCFAKIFSLSHPRKQALLERIAREHTSTRLLPDLELTRIKSVEKTHLKEDVWDISVFDTTHCFYINHCVTGNCGEQPLGAWAVCNLGAMNLAAYVKDADLKNDKPGRFDFENFGKDVKIAMRFMDNVIDNTYYFFPENDKCAKDIRRTGLGIMGIADALILMNIRYGSDDAVQVIDKIFKTLRDSAYEASSDIAKEKGSFPMFDREKYLKGYHIQALPKKIQEKIGKHGIRNAVLLTVAPTGTTSVVAGSSSGIEPVYEFAYKQTWRGGQDMVYHPLYEEWLQAHPGEERPAYFVSANDLTPLEHTKVQAIAQEYIDSSISKTVNAPNSHTVADVEELYMNAYDMGLKGITYMRDGSRQGVLERIEEKPKVKEDEKPAALPMTFETPVALRPTRLNGTTYVTQSPIGKAYITINHTESGDPFEVFITLGKPGSDTAAMADALGRMVSLTLRINAQLEPRERIRIIVEKLAGIGGARSVGFGKNRVRSLPDAVAKVLADHYNFAVNGQVVDRTPLAPVVADNAPDILVTDTLASNGTEATNGHSNGMSNGKVASVTPEGRAQQLTLSATMQEEQHEYDKSTTNLFDLCPDCGATSLAYEEGCKKCYNCGYSEC